MVWRGWALGTGHWAGGPGGGAGAQVDVLLEAPRHDEICAAEQQAVAYALPGAPIGGSQGSPWALYHGAL